MFKKLICLFLAATLSLSACGTFEISIDPTPTPAPTETQTPTATAPPQPQLTQTPPVDPTAPRFSNVAFYRTSLKPDTCPVEYQQVFPARILQVHARWDYANMSAGLSIRREWYSNGKLWARYDEPWNFVKYGAEGSVDDVPIYDLDTGLEPGEYELRLYINEVPQFDSAKKISFKVDKDWALQVVSPNGRLTGIISRPQKLTIREDNGTKWELASGYNITSIDWFSDSKHIVYSDANLSPTKPCSNLDTRHILWIVDASTSTQYQISSDDEDLHDPLISSDGSYIATLSGSGFGDACAVDSGLFFLELAGLQRTNKLSLKDFAGIPTAPNDSMIYPVWRGKWTDATHFEIGLNWTCAPSNNPSGIYSFDLENRLVTRIGDLP